LGLDVGGPMWAKFAGLLAVVFAILTGGSVHAQGPLKVFATVPEWAALVQELGGDKVSIVTAAGPLQDPDRVEVKPALLNQVRDAALLIATGPLEAEWLPNLLRRAGNANVRPGTPGYFAAGDYVRMMSIPKEPGAKVHSHGSGQPHIQADPRNFRAVAVQLGRRLAQVDAPNAAYYSQRTQAFTQKLDESIKRWEAQAAPLKGLNIIVQHDNLNYLFVWLGINQIGTVEPSPGQPPAPAHLAKVIDQIQAQKVRFIVNGAYEEPKTALYVAERAKVPLVTLPFTVGGNEASKDIFALFDDTIARMLKAAGGV